MSSRRHGMLLITAVALVFLLQGCKSFYPVKDLDDRGKLAERIKAGQVVRISTRDNETFIAAVTAITPERISGETVEPDEGEFTKPSKKIDIALDDIAKLEVAKTNKRKTVVTGVVATSVVVVIVVGSVILAFLTAVLGL